MDERLLYTILTSVDTCNLLENQIYARTTLMMISLQRSSNSLAQRSA